MYAYAPAVKARAISSGAVDKALAPHCLKSAEVKMGFTLLELMLVVALIGILSGLAVPAFNAYRERAQVAACIAEIRVIEKDLLAFRIDEDRFPDTLAEVGLGQIRDPWGHFYHYLKIDGAPKSVMGSVRKDRFLVPLNSDFDLYSVGKDGQSKPPLTVAVSADDIIRANDGEFVGRASLY
jgi:general secretion pathway protein G